MPRDKNRGQQPGRLPEKLPPIPPELVPEPAGEPLVPGVPPRLPSLPPAGARNVPGAAPSPPRPGSPDLASRIPAAGKVSSGTSGGGVGSQQGFQSGVPSGKPAPSKASAGGQFARGGRGAAPGRLPPGQSLGTPEQQDEQEEVLETWIDRLLLAAPPWLVSAIVHAVILIILALIFLPALGRRQIELEAIYAEKLGEQLEFDTLFIGKSEDVPQELIITPENLPLVEDPFAAPPEMPVTSLEGFQTTSDEPAKLIGVALSGREEGMKKALLAAYGGTATTEEAVLRGLQWLARQQRKDGSWSLCGPYSDGVREDWENEVAATAMALIAFQGAGNTHRRGQFRTQVERGWKWLLEQQDSEGNFFQGGPFNHRFYTNGLCGIAICELYGMTKDESFREPAERLIQYLLRSQSPEGGWRYSPQADSDLSVTGWIVMALQSARMAGLEVPQDTFRKIERFLDRVSHSGGSRYSYQRGDEPNLAMTAEGLLCRQYLGWRRNDPRLVEGVAFLTQPENLIDYDNPNVYYWYYATQVCHHMEGDAWRKWNERMRQVVPAHQEKSGREAGSWHPLKPRPDAWADHGGRLYVTCLCIYMLEVYYRHLPLYTNVFAVLGVPPPTGN